MSVEDRLAKVSSAEGGEAPAAKQRLMQLFDDGVFTEIDSFAKTAEEGAEVVTGYGTVDGSRVFAFSQNQAAAGGAMGRAQAGKIKKIYELAVKTGAPVVGIYDSNGAYLNEGFEVLSAYGELLSFVSNLSGVVPQVSLVLGPCAGSAALLAAGADVVIMEEKGQLFMAPPSVFAGEGEGAAKVGGATAALENGTAQLGAESEEDAIVQARAVISMLPLNNLEVAPLAEAAAPEVDASALNDLCLKMDGASARDIIRGVADAGSFIELYPAFGKTVVGGFLRINGTACGVIANDRSHNEGRLCASCAAKAAKLVRLFDAFSLPVVTFVDTMGFEATIEAELGGSLRSAAMLAHAYAEATTAKIAVITGRAYGSSFITFAGKGASSDMILAWPSAEIGALAPKAAVTVLWNDRMQKGEAQADLEAEYKETIACPVAAAEGGYIDEVIEPAKTREILTGALDMLAGKRVSRMPKKHSNIPL